MAELHENQNVQEILKLLQEYKPDTAKDFSALLWYVDGMERQFEAVFQELQTVKSQLSEIKDNQNPVKKSFSPIVTRLEMGLEAAREQLHNVKENIVESAGKLLDSVKQNGISALDKTASFFRFKDVLTAVQKKLNHSILDTRHSIEKIESMGKELRSVGGHLSNAARAARGKELKSVNSEPEGRFQAALLAPLRTAHKLFVSMGNSTLAAIGSVERLEQTAEHGRDKKVSKQEEKPSVLHELQTLKAEAAARPPLEPDKEVKPKEATL